MLLTSEERLSASPAYEADSHDTHEEEHEEERMLDSYKWRYYTPTERIYI